MAVLSVPLAELRTRLSVKWRLYEPDILPMWVAEMDTHMHPAVRQTVTEALDRGDTGYAYGTGYADAFSAMAAERWGWHLAPSAQIRRGPDVMASILGVLLATTEPGDGVMINPPVYAPFREVITGYGRRVVEAPLTMDGRLDLGTVEQGLTGPDAPRAYLLCSPHNPTGSVHTAAELTAVMQLANRANVQVIVDEIHARLVDPGTTFVPIQTVPGGERAITVTSAGKAWNLAGFKAGLVIAGPEATQVLLAPPVAGQSTAHLANLAHTAALVHAQDWVDELVVEIAANKALLAELLATHLPGALYSPKPGTYLAWVDCTALGLASPARIFRDRGRVALSSGSQFARSHQQWVRINLACSPDLIREGVTRMAASLA
jgi:cysteine-S-conjugate beta-lyase